MSHKIFSLGDNALTIEFGNEISVELNDRVLRLVEVFDKRSFTGFVEFVPAYSSLTIFYDVFTVRKNFPEFSTAFAAVKNSVENALESLEAPQKLDSKAVEIPVCFDRESALDLDSLAVENNLARQEVIEIFLSQTYRVFMLGFLPGFAYLGEVDERIAARRKNSPRLKVPRGSVAIAGKQAGIYPLASPGGWQIIGRTDIELFTPNEAEPTFLQVGDRVKFHSQNL
ncbi:MAG: 5-oxoprolinase subunit PxpB [Acidobacteria bacterium]|jgi:inhibitor of KinA|nr:5-oxoprolinase subunit PxpB [Acidobacteriota bacterium]